MDKNVLQHIAGVEIYPIISFGIFFLFFLGLLVYMILVNRQYLHEMSVLPLQSEEDTAETQPLSHDTLC